MIVKTARRLSAVAPRRDLYAGGVLVFESLAAGLLEAMLLILVVDVALAVIDPGQAAVSIGLPFLDSAELTQTTALLIAGTAAGLILALHLHVAYLTASISASVLDSLRRRGVAAFSGASWTEQSRAREGALQETVGTLASQSATVVIQLSAFAVAVVALAALLAAALIVDVVVTLVVLAFGALIFLALRPVSIVTRRRARAYVAKSNSFAEEIAQWGNLALELRLLNVAGAEVSRLLAMSERVARAFRRSRFTSRAGGKLYQDFALIFLVAAIAMMASLGAPEIGAVGAIVLLVIRSLGYAQQANSAMQLVNEQGPNLETYLQRVSDLEREYHPRGTLPLKSIGTLTLTDVGYEYAPGIPALEGIRLTVLPGQAVGILGPSGAGKTTLVELLLGLRFPTSGTIRANGVDYRDVQPEEWFARIAFVPQQPHLYEATIAENIAFFRPDISEADIMAAANGAHLFADAATAGAEIHKKLGPRGLGLSGGQRQRLAVARALVGNPEVIVFDEPTSALDVLSEALLKQTLESLKTNRTLFVVAHRLTTLSICDRVMAIDAGRLVAFGSLDEAMTAVKFDLKDTFVS